VQATLKTFKLQFPWWWLPEGRIR